MRYLAPERWDQRMCQSRAPGQGADRERLPARVGVAGTPAVSGCGTHASQDRIELGAPGLLRLRCPNRGGPNVIVVAENGARPQSMTETPDEIHADGLRER